MFNLIFEVCDYSKEGLLTEEVHSNTFLVFSMGIFFEGVALVLVAMLLSEINH